MDHNKKIELFGIVIIFLLCIVGGYQTGRLVEKRDAPVGAYTQYGLPGIYHNPVHNIPDGEGTAVEVDSQGRMIISTSTSITVNLGS